MTDVLQTALPYDAHTPKPLPGISPLDPADFVIVDEAYAGQMAIRQDLLAHNRDAVLAMDDGAGDAARELMEVVVEAILARPEADFVRDGDAIRCPDGRLVVLDATDPLATVGRLVQEDMCILQKRGDEHVMTGAVLCFPASWLLSEKFLRPLVGIHVPVASYTDNIAKRVQRLFDGVRAGRPIWRFNALWYADAILHQPRSASQRRPQTDPDTAPFFRSERQAIMRLPKSDAVVFSIHTYILARQDALQG